MLNVKTVLLFIQHLTFNISHFFEVNRMYTEHVSWHSNALGRPMEFLWYGKFGRPVMLFPTSAGRYSENADRGIPDSLADKVDGGEIQLVLVDTVNEESWYNRGVHPAVRAARHAQYDAYLRHELVPYIFNRAQRGDLAVYGASFGAYHAANFAARYPDVVSRAICFSGIYDIHAQLDGYWDETCYFNCPICLHPEHGRRVGGQTLARRLDHRHRRVRHDRRQEPRVLVAALVERDSESTWRSGAASSATTGRGGKRICAGFSE